MSSIRELSFDEIAQVSGGGNSGDHEHNWSSPRGSASRNGGPAPVTAANNAGIGAILGTIGALVAGATPVGVGVAAVIGGITAAMPSASSSNNDRNGSWHDTNPGGMVGECRW
jgi:hypothetical protein